MNTSLHCRVTRPDKCNSHCVVGVSRVSLAAVSTAILRNYSDRINVSFIRPQMRIHYDDDKGGGYVILISRERVFVRCQSGLTTPSTFRLPTTIIIRLIQRRSEVYTSLLLGMGCTFHFFFQGLLYDARLFINPLYYVHFNGNKKIYFAFFWQFQILTSFFQVITFPALISVYYYDTRRMEWSTIVTLL